MKKNFLTNWRCSTPCGGQSKWDPSARGSSLDENELKMLENGGVVKKSKGKGITKLFVRDEELNLWSIIVYNAHLAALEDNLRKVGYLLAL